MSAHRTALVWFRRDLRLADNPALRHAVEHAGHIVPVFIHAPEEEGRWAPGAATRWWLNNSLAALDDALRERGSRLVVRQGPTLPSLRELIRDTGATLVTWNRLYEPAIVERDTGIMTALQSDGIEAASRNAALLFEPWTIRNAQHQPYRVFTPFWRAAERELDRTAAPLRAPRTLPPPANWPASVPIGTLELLPAIRWDAGLAAHWTPGEGGALRQLGRFESLVAEYAGSRDRPDIAGTSRLSPHLHFGEIGPRQILAALDVDRATGAATRSLDACARELGWREFAHHLLFHFPHTPDRPLDARFEHWRWSRDRNALRAWQRGQTGIPIVDAGMRELWHSGWMHNRVRMIAASLLAKNLQIDWLDGARWFWDTLVDADLANNTLGWQWTAGCGADAAPYYRIFNPVLQAERFDPDRAYIRKWVPELARLPDRWIHRPWAAPAGVLSSAAVHIGTTYPHPIVDLRRSRDEALAGYEHMKSAAN